MNQRLKLSQVQYDRLRRWCLMRQDGGFQGRPGKPSDTCYSFWVGATLNILHVGEWTDAKQNKDFILNTQDSLIGGFAKFENTRPDPLHAYLGKCGGIRPFGKKICVVLNIATFVVIFIFLLFDWKDNPRRLNLD